MQFDPTAVRRLSDENDLTIHLKREMNIL